MFPDVFLWSDVEKNAKKNGEIWPGFPGGVKSSEASNMKLYEA